MSGAATSTVANLVVERKEICATEPAQKFSGIESPVFTFCGRSFIKSVTRQVSATQTSIFRATNALLSIKFRRGSTSSPISVVKI